MNFRRAVTMCGLLLLCASSARAIDTTITGGRMELLNKGDQVLFVGGVRLDRGGDRLTADKMVTNKKRDKVDAEGNVQLFRRVSSTETWEAFGNSGFYNTQQGSGYLLGNAKAKAHIVHTEVLSSTSSRVVHIYADRIDFERLAKQATATGNVQGTTTDPQTGDQFSFQSSNAFFDGQENKIVLTGVPQPVVVQTLADGKRILKGDKIVYFHKTQQMISDGNAEAVFEDRGDKKKK